jgi:hypothetical protein
MTKTITIICAPGEPMVIIDDKITKCNLELCYAKGAHLEVEAVKLKVVGP